MASFLQCVFMGMAGYAKSFTTAKYYAKSYHSEMRETDIKPINSDYYMETPPRKSGFRRTDVQRKRMPLNDWGKRKSKSAP